MTILFISDLHLSPERPQIVELFKNFLVGPARSARSLYILGDLFDYWVGDEMVSSDGWSDVVTCLRGLSKAGVEIAVVRGNRDFLMGDDFAAASGSRLLPEESVVNIHGTAALIMHGDSLCTDDTEHQAWRRQVLGSQWQQEFLAQPLGQRIRIARSLRSESESRKKTKPMDIMDVSQETVIQRMRHHGVSRLIHGHTHRPAVHELQLDGAPARRYVLGDWYEQGSVLTCTPEQWKLDSLS